MNTSPTRCLPTYQDVNGPYSLRLPTYRSSYIRRYHPYARYTTPIVPEQFTDEIDYDEPVLDLSILDRRVEPARSDSQTIRNANQGPSQLEHPVEGHELNEASLPMVNAETDHSESDDQVGLDERADQNIAFIRVDVNASS